MRPLRNVEFVRRCLRFSLDQSEGGTLERSTYTVVADTGVKLPICETKMLVIASNHQTSDWSELSRGTHGDLCGLSQPENR